MIICLHRLQEACDGQTSCSYMYEGQQVDECELGATADYLNVIYHCTGILLYYM